MRGELRRPTLGDAVDELRDNTNPFGIPFFLKWAVGWLAAGGHRVRFPLVLVGVWMVEWNRDGRRATVRGGEQQGRSVRRGIHLRRADHGHLLSAVLPGHYS
jgi:hypothetical protein